jgi:hypothetical protein
MTQWTHNTKHQIVLRDLDSSVSLTRHSVRNATCFQKFRSNWIFVEVSQEAKSTFSISNNDID